MDPAIMSTDNQSLMPTSQPAGEGEGNYATYKPLYRAVFNGDWESAKGFVDLHPNALTASISSSGEQALHVAAVAGQLKIVEELVKLIPAQDLALVDGIGLTALHHAACTGIVKIAECMLKVNSSLVCIQSREGLIPVVVAAVYGLKDMARYLYNLTPKTELSPEKGWNGATLLTSSILADYYDLALDLLQDHPQLVFARDVKNLSALEILGRKPSAYKSGSRLSFWQRRIYSCIHIQSTTGLSLRKIHGDIERPQEGQSGRENMIIQLFNQLYGLVWNLIIVVPGIEHIHYTKLKHFQAIELLRRIFHLLSNSDDSKLENLGAHFATFDAVKHGIVEFVDEIIKFHPPLLWSTDNNGQILFMNAVVYRQEKIFSLLYGLGSLTTRFVTCRDNFGNNMLHLAGNSAPSWRLDRESGAALQLQRELQWFKAVESIVLPMHREDANGEGKTPRSLFSEQHKGLVKTGERWMKDTASSCMVVATLIATVMFDAAFTVPGGSNEETGIPLLLPLSSIQVFIISDALSLFSSSTSVLMFLAILTARYAEEDFIKSLPQKLIIGLSTLFFSMATMMIAFAAAVVSLVTDRLPWVTIPIYLLACIPVSLFALLQFRLLVEICSSTYRTDIFNEQTTRRSY